MNNTKFNIGRLVYGTIIDNIEGKHNFKDPFLIFQLYINAGVKTDKDIDVIIPPKKITIKWRSSTDKGKGKQHAAHSTSKIETTCEDETTDVIYFSKKRRTLCATSAHSSALRSNLFSTMQPHLLQLRLIKQEMITSYHHQGSPLYFISFIFYH